MPTEPSGSDSHQTGTAATSGPVSQHPHNSTTPAPAHESPFGANLEPFLRDACAGRLSQVGWFRTDWQRGGALTGYATYRDDRSQDQAVVVKLPVGPSERQWLLRLESQTDIVPRVWADGQTLGGYDIAWVVMERLPHGPLSAAWEGNAFDLLVEAVGRFYAASQQTPIDRPPPAKDWQQIFQFARESVKRRNLAHPQRWNKALKKAGRKLNEWIDAWDSRPTDQWCHGDLHLANAMTRTPPPNGPALLLDFALTHPGHWTEDAVYVEHLYWARRDKLFGRKVCKQIAQERRKLNLQVSDDWPRYATAQRALLAMSTPADLRHNGDPQHVQAALEVLENEAGVT